MSALIYLVDDEPLLLEILSQYLSKGPLGWKVECFSTPSLAIEAAGLHHPDIVISDLAMPEMSATTLRIPPRGLVPVIGDNVVVTKPTIAAVNGVAFAGGFLISQMCDLCIAADHATFGITEAKVGRGSPWATPLIHMLPQRVMMEILLTAAPVGAQRLYELGYVNKVVPLADLLDEALKMANMIAANAPLTVQACRRSVYMATEMGRSAALEAARAAFDSAYLSEDAQEGPRAFAEKRAPVWKGR